jgi:RNA polymerase sigma-70 factor (ECF subfamily)
MIEPLEQLLEQVRQGNPDAAAQLVAAYEPDLRQVVHRSLPDRVRPRFDSVDVVQSVWAHVLPGLRAGAWHFADRSRLRAFLVKVARRRLICRVRRHCGAARREQRGGADLDALPALEQPRPSEEARATELWEQMLALCPPGHHELLLLRRQGLALEEIARRTGLHEGSVRRVLRQLARRLALLREPLEDDGGRRER